MKKAFTLAEVLITLGIIGVIASLTIPALINKTNKRELETAFKKQYSTLQQAVMMIKTEDSLDLDYENYGSDFSKRLAAQYKSTKDCGTIKFNTGCILKNEDNSFTYYKTFNGNTLMTTCIDDGGFITPDGILLLIEQGNQAKNITGYLVSIDVNGYIKKPNKMGYDLFMFQITKDGRVLPMGANDTYWGTKTYRESFCNKNSTSDQNGFTCAYYALTDNDYFKNLK
ncbi:unknown [Clostridium sp. CAG:768]|nr:unknown [Clostridium sp. CAG:768]